MAISGRFRVAFGEVFPAGLYMWADGAVLPARDFERSSREQQVQAVDPDTGAPVWTVDALDPDEQARGKQNAVTVRIVADECPVLPDTASGPVRPIELENLSVAAYVEQPANGRPRVAWSYRATGVVAPGRQGSGRSNGQAGQGKEQPKEQAA